MKNSSVRGGGRPPKFQEASKPVTLTLPERTLEKLEQVDPDRAKAIVKLVDHAVQNLLCEPQSVEVAPGIHLLMVPSTPILNRLEWIRLIEVSPGRFLVTLEPGTSNEKIEVALSDLIEGGAAQSPVELQTLLAIRKHLTQMRRSDAISRAEILVFQASGSDVGNAMRNSQTGAGSGLIKNGLVQLIAGSELGHILMGVDGLAWFPLIERLV